MILFPSPSFLFSTYFQFICRKSDVPPSDEDYNEDDIDEKDADDKNHDGV